MVDLLPRVLLVITSIVFVIHAQRWLVAERGLSRLEAIGLALGVALILGVMNQALHSAVLVALPVATLLACVYAGLTVPTGPAQTDRDQLTPPTAPLLTRRTGLVRAAVCVLCILCVLLIPGGTNPGPLNCGSFVTGTTGALTCENMWVTAHQQHATHDAIVVVAWIVAFIGVAPWNLWGYAGSLIAWGSRRRKLRRNPWPQGSGTDEVGA